MSIWTFKNLAAASALVVLGGCEDGQGGLQGLTTASAAATNPLTKSRMANGAVTLSAPPGYCIDKSSLRARFALLARCDALGSAQEVDAALGIITISLLPADAEGALPTPQETAKAARLVRIADATSENGAVIFQADGPAPVDGMSPRHWRGTALVGGHIFGVAFYGPDGGRATTSEGRDVVGDLIRRSAAAS